MIVVKPYLLTEVSLLVKVALIPLLCCICVVLLATLQSPTRGQQFFIEEEATEEEIIAEEESEVLFVYAMYLNLPVEMHKQSSRAEKLI